jgi:hypothetical protein
MTRRGVRGNANAYSAGKTGAAIKSYKAVCVKHGARVKLCRQDGCRKNAKQGGVCDEHGTSKRKCRSL